MTRQQMMDSFETFDEEEAREREEALSESTRKPTIDLDAVERWRSLKFWRSMGFYGPDEEYDMAYDLAHEFD